VAIWDQTNGVRRLIDLIPANSAWEFEIAYSINDFGDIAGYGQLNGETRGFLLRRIPEPHTTMLLIASVILAGANLRIRRIDHQIAVFDNGPHDLLSDNVDRPNVASDAVDTSDLLIGPAAVVGIQ
jgi:hypothetical protein